MPSFIVLIRIKLIYFLLCLILLDLEILIAVYMHDRIIRPYGGDFLVVILLYCLVRSITNLSIPVASASALLLSWLTEALQYFKLADRLRIQPDSFFYILLGNYYSWTDMIIYTLGIFAVLFFEKIMV